MTRLLIALLATSFFVAPMANAQNGGVSLGPTNRTNTQLFQPGGSYYYPGFGYSSRPLPQYGGYGYNPYNPYGTVPLYTNPINGAPLAVPGVSGYFRIGGARVNYWQAPSGYYYPWGAGAIYNQPAPVYYINQGVTTPQLPPLSAQFTDMEKYLDESKEKNKLTQADYTRLFRRLQDLRGKFDHIRAAGGGTADENDEANMRRDVDLLGAEIARAVKPIAGK